MSRRRIQVDIVFDELQNDPPAEHVVRSIQDHLRKTGHPALVNAQAILKKELT